MKIVFAVSAAAIMLATPAAAGTDWGKVCASYYLTPGTPEFKDCVAKMTNADKATNGTLMQGGDTDKQRARMQAQTNRQMPDAKSQGSNCVTTVRGTNRSTVCSSQPPNKVAAGPQQQQWSHAPAQQAAGPQQQSQHWNGPRQPQGGISVVGTWSAGTPQNGIAFAFNPDGSYVNVAGGSGGSQRLWGRYRATPVSGSRVRLEFQLMGWAPRQMCAQVAGGARVCRPYNPMHSDSAILNFTSASTFEAGQTQFNRDPSPYFLQIQVPEILERNVANMSANMRQPVMPTLHPYRTPGGAGSVGAMRYDDEHQQPQRICSVNGGSVYTDQQGVQHCSN